MNIIKKGDLKRLDKTRRFTCDMCGCIWEANQKEYRRDDMFNELLVCSCPTCGSDTYASLKGNYWEDN